MRGGQSALYQVEPLRLQVPDSNTRINEASDETKGKERENLSHGRKQQILETIQIRMAKKKRQKRRQKEK